MTTNFDYFDLAVDLMRGQAIEAETERKLRSGEPIDAESILKQVLNDSGFDIQRATSRLAIWKLEPVE